MENQIDNRKYADMRSDLAFKRAFGSEKYKDATIGLLQSILPDQVIKDVSFINSEMQGISTQDRKGVIDVLCETDSGSFIIEMQKAGHSRYINRTVFYGALNILRQSRKGDEWHFEMKDPYIISFINFNEPAFKEQARYCHHYVTADTETREKMPGSTEYIFFDLNRFTAGDFDECANDTEIWLYLLKNSGNLENIPVEKLGKGFKAFEEAAHISNFSREEMIQYEKDMVTEADLKLALKENYEKGEAKGREEGRTEGRAEGREEGRTEGREEGRAAERRDLAVNLKNLGVPIETIAQATGLEIKEIDVL